MDRLTIYKSKKSVKKSKSQKVDNYCLCCSFYACFSQKIFSLTI